MHKKQTKITLLAPGIIGLLTACGNKNQDTLYIEDGTMSTESGEYLVDSFAEERLNLTKYYAVL